MSDQPSEPAKAETGIVGAGPAAADNPAARELAASSEIESPMLAPEQEQTAPAADATKAEVSGMQAPKLEAAKAEKPRNPGKLLIMSPGDRAWSGEAGQETAKGAAPGKRRMAMAAVVALATVAGAAGGALATAGLGHFLGNGSASNNLVVDASIARIDAEIVALKASVEHASKAGVAQFNKTSDRLDKVEKAQAEPAAKLARLSDAVEKLRTQAAAPAAAVAATPAAAKDVTGTVSPTVTAAAAAPVPLPAPKPEVARLPTIEGWVLRDVMNGSALIEGRQGMFEVYAGDPVPGLGRIDAIRKQDGRWVVVTSKGLIVAR